jgi:hypothetical protein
MRACIRDAECALVAQLRAPNRHAAVFDPVQQSRQWETRILAEERLYLASAKDIPKAEAAAPVAAPTVPVLASSSVVPVTSEYKPAHYFNHRGIERPDELPSARSKGKAPVVAARPTWLRCGSAR